MHQKHRFDQFCGICLVQLTVMTVAFVCINVRCIHFMLRILQFFLKLNKEVLHYKPFDRHLILFWQIFIGVFYSVLWVCTK